MPTYHYKCPKCGHDQDVVKTVSMLDDLETCENCKFNQLEGKHRILGVVQFYGEKPEEPFYSIPLGKMVSGKTQMRKLAKERGMIEVGNENVDKLHDASDNQREAKSKERWAEFSKPIELNG